MECFLCPSIWDKLVPQRGNQNLDDRFSTSECRNSHFFLVLIFQDLDLLEDKFLSVGFRLVVNMLPQERGQVPEMCLDTVTPLKSDDLILRYPQARLPHGTAPGDIVVIPAHVHGIPWSWTAHSLCHHHVVALPAFVTFMLSLSLW